MNDWIAVATEGELFEGAAIAVTPIDDEIAIYKTEGRSYIDAEFSPQEYGVATKKGSDLSAVVDECVRACAASGWLDAEIEKWGLV